MRTAWIAGLMVGAGMSLALAQEPREQDPVQAPKDQAPMDRAPEDQAPRQLTHEDGDTTSTLSAHKQGESWEIDLHRKTEKEGKRSLEQLQLSIPRSPEADRRLNELFQQSSSDPAEWRRVIEELSGMDLGVAGQGGLGFEERASEIQERMRQVREELERALEGAFGGSEREGVAGEEDRLHLIDGSVVSGKITSLTDQGVEVQAQDGKVMIERERIRRIEFAQAQSSEHPSSEAQPPEAQSGTQLGVVVEETPAGLRVTEVRVGSPARSAGILTGDVIESAGGQPVSSADQLRELVAGKKAGESLDLVVMRGEARLELEASFE